LFNPLGQTTNTTDSAGMSTTSWFHNHGLLVSVSNTCGRVQATPFDSLDRATNSTDANGVTVTMTFDTLDRVLTRTFPDGGVESFGDIVCVAAFTSQASQIGSNVLNAAREPI